MARPDAAPREDRFPVFDALGLAVLFGQSGPGDLWVGVRDGGDLPRVEIGRMSRGVLRRNMGLVDSFVGQHRLADDVADLEDVRHVGPHLLVDGNEATVADRNPGLLGCNLLSIRTAPDRHQDHVVGLRSFRRLRALEGDAQTIARGFHGRHLRLEHHVLEATRIFLLPDFYEVAVSTHHQAVEHLDDVDPGT